MTPVYIGSANWPASGEWKSFISQSTKSFLILSGTSFLRPGSMLKRRPWRAQTGPQSQQWPEMSGPAPASHSVWFLMVQSEGWGSTLILILGNFSLKSLTPRGAATMLKGLVSSPQVDQRRVTSRVDLPCWIAEGPPLAPHAARIAPVPAATVPVDRNRLRLTISLCSLPVAVYPRAPLRGFAAIIRVEGQTRK